ncbi:hypothetical protein E3Q06_03010 [Wallemia mellicola]|uniref:CxC6 like cysteine cluster associated with KDZ domain-containing protein n=1 Tax=Wallemia mellicola TaxID=1708541 RepID=A0AB38MEZ7_9BASI|nr:hypothetical protein E3Q24_02828 [Wallemia mellicola]TIB83224.1 hypothetical protein E3Q21_03024 [Wallemia mellicola]TIB86021.1 hypothetical protein E3Q20_03015 [Wallemia mellicola]TIC39438.1 hypothetical protein E3Q07_03032 [Wallemia mellicola]TIC47625.1 hypothetical protein E3Q06_03010 [Wallemia mellicola]
MDTEGEAIVIFDDDMIVDLDDNSDDDITVINSDINDEKISQSIQIKKVVGKSAFECLSKTTGIVEDDCDCSSCRDILTARSENITHGELCICNTGKCAKTCKRIKNGESCGKAIYRGDHCYEHTIKSRAEKFNRDTTLKNCEHKGCTNRHSPNSQFCAIHRDHQLQHRRDVEAMTDVCLKESCQHRSAYGNDYCYHHRHIPRQNIINKVATLSKCKIPDCQHKCWKNTPYCYVVHNRFATQYICDENPSLQKCMIKNCNHKQYANTPFCFLKHMANRSRYKRFMETDRVSQCCVQSCEEQASNDSPYCVQAHNNLREQCLINNENTLGNCHEPNCDNRVSDTELFCKLHGNKVRRVMLFYSTNTSEQNEQGFYEQNTDNSVCIHAECDMKNIQIAPFCIESHFTQAKAYVSYINSAKCEMEGCKERAESDVPYCASRHKHRNYQWKRDQDVTLEKCAVPNCSHRAKRGWVYCVLSHHHLERHFRQSRANNTPPCAMKRCTKASSGDTIFCTASHKDWVAEERAKPGTNYCEIPVCPLKATGRGPHCNIYHSREFFLDRDVTKPICSAEGCDYHTNEDEPFCVLGHYTQVRNKPCCHHTNETQLKTFRNNKRRPAENPEAGTSAGPSKVARRN